MSHPVLGDEGEECLKKLLEVGEAGIFGSGENLVLENLPGIYKNDTDKTPSNSRYAT